MDFASLRAPLVSMLPWSGASVILPDTLCAFCGCSQSQQQREQQQWVLSTNGSEKGETAQEGDDNKKGGSDGDGDGDDSNKENKDPEKKDGADIMITRDGGLGDHAAATEAAAWEGLLTTSPEPLQEAFREEDKDMSRTPSLVDCLIRDYSLHFVPEMLS